MRVSCMLQTVQRMFRFFLSLAGFTILVRTGNSVDYSLAIRLLSLPWLSPLHHEIAWLSTGLECTSAKSPFFCSALSLSLSLSPSLFPSRVHVATLRSTQHTHIRLHSREAVGLAVRTQLPHFLWPFLYPHIFSYGQPYLIIVILNDYRKFKT